MNKEEINEVLQAVENITDELYDKQVNWNQLYLPEFSRQWGISMVSFMGIGVWRDDEDDREWVEGEMIGPNEYANGQYEDIEPYLRKKINEIVSTVSTIKL